MDDEVALKDSVSNLRDAILLRRADIVRSILSTAAEFREEGELFGDDEEDDPIARQRYFEEYTDPYDILKLILNYVDSDAGTCLHLATKLGFADGVRALLAAGADPTIANHEGATAFDYCTDKNILGIYNEELLQAAAGGNIPRVSRLLKCGMSPNASDGAQSDNKVLHWVASYGTEEMIKLLCENDADVNILNANGETPLHDAVKRGDDQVVQTLLEFGANPNVKATTGCNKGKTPVDLASDDVMRSLFVRPASTKDRKIVQNGVLLGNDRDFSDADSIVSESAASVETAPLLLCPSPSMRMRHLSSGSNVGTSTKHSLFGTLWPSPQRVLQVKGGHYKPSSTLPVHIHRPSTGCLQELCTMWETMESHFKQAGYEIDMTILAQDSEWSPLPSGGIDCKICPNLFTRPESYKINVSTAKMSIVASEAVSMWYALNTVLQLLRSCKDKGVPISQISDWPDIKYRGILLDVSSGRVPTMETLLSLVDVLSSVKINQLQLYMPNTFAYRGHESVHRNNTPYTQSDIIKLDKYCKARYIELVPHVESLSGFSQWIKFKQYAHLAEIPIDLEELNEKVPSCICPSSQESINFILDLHKQTFPCFSSSRFAHVGIDVTDEFGRGKSYVIAEAKGKDGLYIDYIQHVYNSCRSHGRTMQFWANPLHEHPPQLLGNLPTDIIAMEYGARVDYDFMKHCSLLSDAGVGFFVCPGTLTWNSACANTDDSLTLINNAVQAAVTCDALGMLVCDWALPGHVNPLCMSIPAFLAAAGLSWKADTDMTVVQSSLPDIVSRHAFLDASGKIGVALNDLGKVHSLLVQTDTEHARNSPLDTRGVHPVAYSHQGTLLWRLLHDGGDTELTMGLETLQKATRHIRQCQATYSPAEPKCAQNSEILKELDITIDILLYLCRMCRVIILAKKQKSEVKTLKDVPIINRTDLANRLLGLIGHYQKVYLLRNKQGGLLSAKKQLQKILLRLLPHENEMHP